MSAQPAAAAVPARLDYADLPARWGVCAERDPACLRVIVPPVPNWRYLVRSHLWGVLLFGFGLCSAAATALTAPFSPVNFVGVGIWTTLLAVVVAHAYARLRTRTILLVTADALTVTTCGPFGRALTR